MKGIVLRSTGSWYKIQSGDKVLDGRLRGKMRTLDLKTTNPIAVGDHVAFTEEEDGTVSINEVLKRKNYIIRKSTRSHAQAHVLAANLDQAALIVTLREPRTSLGFIDRFLVLTESFRIPAILVFNKVDTYSPKQLELLEAYEEVYKNINYPCYRVSAVDPAYKATIEELFINKTTLLAGHSGAGKSTMINLLNPDLDIKTAGISNFSKKGKHTTTYVEMHQLAKDAFVIDSPGIKELGLYDIQKPEISHYFVEMRDYLNKCKFNNCTHDHEPGCAVAAAAESEEISPSRYYNYLSILNGEDFKDR